MGLISGIYDNGPMTPVVKIKQNVSVWSGGKWEHYNVNFIEPLPRSTPGTVDMVIASGATTIAANGAIQKQVVNLLLMQLGELYQLRWEPVDDVEGRLWEISSTGRFVGRNLHARVTRFTDQRDPWLNTTQFFIMGKDRDMNLEVINPNPVALPQARFIFWGFRYVLDPLQAVPAETTYIPAEGK